MNLKGRDKEIAIAFGLRLRELREQRTQPLTQLELAQAIGAGLTTVRNWEQGISAPNWIRVVRIIEVLGIKADDLHQRPSNGTASEPRGRGRPPKDRSTQ